MGFVAHILLALASLALPELIGASEGQLPGFVPVLFAVPYLLGAATRRLLMAGRFRQGAYLERLLALSPPLLQIVAVMGLGWLQTVEQWTGLSVTLSGWPGLELLLGLVPFFVVELLTIDARIRLLDEPRERLRTSRAFQTRLFLSALVPFVVYLGVASLVALRESWRIHIEEVALIGACFSVGVLVLFVVALPTILRNTWDTAPLPSGPLRGLLEELARRAGFRCREILVWRTGHQMANAAIVGFTPGSRVVLLSDLLLAHLEPREILAVFAHEMGHALRRHAMTFASFALIAFLALDLLLTWSEVEEAWIALTVFVGVLGLWYFSFGMLSRRFELEADLVSLELVGDREPLVRALDKVGGAHAHERSSWRHFSNAQRARFLAEVEHDPEVGVRLRQKLARWSRAGGVLLVVVLGLQAFVLGESWGEDRIVVALRLGEYEAAQARAEGRELDERLSELLDAARAAGTGDPEELEDRALAALGEGELQVALDRVELAILRGRGDLERVYDALEARLAEPGEPTPEDLPGPWREALGNPASND